MAQPCRVTVARIKVRMMRARHILLGDRSLASHVFYQYLQRCVPVGLKRPGMACGLQNISSAILNPIYDVINDVISGFAKVVERCGFHHSIAQRISWGEVVSVFLYLL